MPPTCRWRAPGSRRPFTAAQSKRKRAEMTRGLRLGALVVALVTVFLGPCLSAASADEPLSKGAEGAFELKGTNGYRIVGLVGSTGEGNGSVLTLLVGVSGGGAVYSVRGEVTKEHVRFD